MNKYSARLAISKQEMFAFIHLIYNKKKKGNEDGKARYQNEGMTGFLPELSAGVLSEGQEDD